MNRRGAYAWEVMAAVVTGVLSTEARDFTLAEMVRSGHLKPTMAYPDVFMMDLVQAAAAKFGVGKS